MTAFIIGPMMIHDRGWMDEYFTSIPSVVARHTGAFRARGGAP